MEPLNLKHTPTKLEQQLAALIYKTEGKPGYANITIVSPENLRAFLIPIDVKQKSEDSTIISFADLYMRDLLEKEK